MAPRPSLGAGIAGGLLGGAAGAIPNKGNSTTNESSNSQGGQTSSTQTSGNTETQSLINYLSNLTGHSTGTSSGTGTVTSTPNLNPASLAFINSLMGRFNSLSTPSLTGYGAYQTNNINNASDVQSQAVNNILASRGLSTSPVAGTAAMNIDQNRINQITGMQQQLPLMRNQMDLQNLGAAGSFASMLPGLFGSTQSQQQAQQTGQDTSQTGSGQQSGETNTQTWQDVLNVINQWESGNKTSTTQTQQGGGIGGFLSGLISTGLSAATLFSDKRLKHDIRPIEKAISKIREIQPRTWKWNGGSRGDAGVIAQELEKSLPDLVSSVRVKSQDVKTVNYAGLIPYLIGAVKELDVRTAEVLS